MADGSATGHPLLLATLLREQGETGVQAHLGAFRRYLEDQGRFAPVLTPFQANPLLLYPALTFRRFVEPLSGALAVLWYRAWHSRLLGTVLSRYLSAAQPCVVYAQCPLSAWAAMRARKNGRQRVVLVVHFNRSQAIEWAEKGMIRQDAAIFRAIRRMERELLPRLDGVVYVSHYMRALLERDIPGLASIPFAVIPNFCDPTERTDYEPIGDLISVGTLEPRKNQEYLLRVLARARDLGYRYTLALVGNGPDREALEREAASLGVTGQVSFLGYRQNAAELLPGYRMYVHGAGRENLPLAIIEALSRGLPVAAAAVGGIPEIFNDGVEGVFWPLQEPEVGARRLIDVLEDRESYTRMSRAARERFALQFDTAVVAVRLASFIDRCGGVTED